MVNIDSSLLAFLCNGGYLAVRITTKFGFVLLPHNPHVSGRLLSGFLIASQNIYDLMCHQFFYIGSSYFQIFSGVKGGKILCQYLAHTGGHGKTQV